MASDEAGSSDEMAYYVTLDQAAALVNRTKRTLVDDAGSYEG